VGPPKQIDGPPVHLLNPRPTHPPVDLFFLFFLVRFRAFLGKGSTKHHNNIFAKSPCRKLFPKNRQISMSVFPQLFRFYRGFGYFPAMGVQRHYRKRLTKKSCRKVFTKEISILFCHVFWAFLAEGSLKTPHKMKKNDPIPFCRICRTQWQ
jgi:hypothetical protein